MGWKQNLIIPIIWCFLQKISNTQFALQQPEINPNTNEIPVLEFQGDGYASAETWALYNGTVKEDLISFTICHRFQLWYQRPRMYIFGYAQSDAEANELSAEYHLGRESFRLCKRGTKYCAYYDKLPKFYEWTHICVTYDGYKDIYKVFINGEKVDSGSWTGENSLELLRSKGILYLGQDQDSFGGGFQLTQSWSGLISQFNWWDFPLEDFFIENVAECRSDLLGNVQKWKEEMWTLNKVVLKKVPLFELCGSPDPAEQEYFLFPLPYEHHFYTAWCLNQGGKIISPTNDENYHALMDTAENLVNREIHEKCLLASGSLNIWNGLTDQWEEDLWVNPYSKEPTEASFWQVGQEFGNPSENCAKTGDDRKWQVTNCNEKLCSLCHFPIAMNLSMRGLCASETKIMEGFFDMFYFVKGFVNLKPHWRGLGKSHIYFIPERQTWRLESYYDLDKYAEFYAEDSNPYDYFPTGRSLWFVNQGICQLDNNAKYKMTLSNCIFNDGTGYDYTCTDGTCISINKRCDLVDDCPDASDERDCNILTIPKGYKSEIFPISATGDPILVTSNITILSFPKINTLDLSYTVDFILLLKWADPRLQFENLRDVSELNSLSSQLIESIWTPTLSFPNARQAEGTVVDTGSISKVVKKGFPIPDQFDRAVEATVYRGIDSPIIMEREYYVEFNCDYELSMYPFDTQICKMEFEVNGIPDKYLLMSAEIPEDCDSCFGAVYLGNRVLVEYIVGDTVMESVVNQTRGYGKVILNVVFKRRWIYHLVTIFVQSVALLIVAYMTFYFKLSNFSDRVMIAITIINVVATVQSSIGTLVPKTSYLKMIDYWLLYSFNINIIIMASHVLLDAAIPRDSLTGLATNPCFTQQQYGDESDEENEKLSFFGENPGWEPGWVKAYRLMKLT